MIVPRRWGRQPTYHQHKKGRSRRQYTSYRTISLSNVELRVCEELWAGRNIEALWIAAGPTQMGREDSSCVLFIDIETTLIREEWGLPSGTLDLDLEEAHDTASRPEVVMRLRERAGVEGEDLVLAAELLEGSSVEVHGGPWRTSPYRPTIGVPEGRVLASAFFAVSATAYPEASAQGWWGLASTQTQRQCCSTA